MPSILAAGDATNGVVLTSSNDNALTIQTGAAGAKVNAAAFASDGTLTLVKPMAGGSLTLGTAQNTTSGTSIDFTSIPSWVKRVTVMFEGVSTNGTSVIQFQLGSGSVQTTGYTSQSWTASVSGGVVTSGIYIAGSTLAANAVTGTLTLLHMGSNKWVGTGIMNLDNASNVGYQFEGKVTLSGALDRIRLTTVGGTDNFDAGSINILYEG